MEARICSFIRVAQAGKPGADLRDKSRDLHLQGLRGLLILSLLSRTLSFFSSSSQIIQTTYTSQRINVFHSCKDGQEVSLKEFFSGYLIIKMSFEIISPPKVILTKEQTVVVWFFLHWFKTILAFKKVTANYETKH